MAMFGGAEVGLAVGAELATSERIHVHMKPGTKRQDHNSDQEQKPKQNGEQRKRVRKKPWTDRSQNQHNVGPCISGPQAGKDTHGEQSIDRKLKHQEYTHEGSEQLEHGRRLKRQQPSGRIQNKEEVGLS